jgi:hypothetical protein
VIDVELDVRRSFAASSIGALKRRIYKEPEKLIVGDRLSEMFLGRGFDALVQNRDVVRVPFVLCALLDLVFEQSDRFGVCLDVIHPFSVLSEFGH